MSSAPKVLWSSERCFPFSDLPTSFEKGAGLQKEKHDCDGCSGVTYLGYQCERKPSTPAAGVWRADVSPVPGTMPRKHCAFSAGVLHTRRPGHLVQHPWVLRIARPGIFPRYCLCVSIDMYKQNIDQHPSLRREPQ